MLFLFFCKYIFAHIDLFHKIFIILSNTFFSSEPALIKILDWNTAKDKMWNGIVRYGFIGPTTSTTDISLNKSPVFEL